MAQNDKKIYVYEQWSSDQPRLLGTLFVEFLRNKEAVSFAYDPNWLKNNKGVIALDPDLFFYEGRQYAPLNKNMFGVFADSCPDRWGRMLMRRREAEIAKREKRKPRELTETDLLLGVDDESRMGALRFSLDEGGSFLSSDPEFATPPWATLRELEHAALSLEDKNPKQAEKWLKQLLAPGSSLGGARPKASVLDPGGELWIAKFPSRNDETDIGAWEMVAHELAVLCHIHVPEAKLLKLSEYGTTYLTKRFDRDGVHRIHFASAMTLLGRIDSEEPGSYLDLAAFIKANGSNPKSDLEELWKRVVFNILISNTDDHLRNHGFLLSEQGWKLSPAYDMNPVPYGQHLSLCIDEKDSQMLLESALETASYYGLTKKQAETMISEMADTIKRRWKYLAKKNGLSRRDVEYMQPAFNAAE